MYIRMQVPPVRAQHTVRCMGGKIYYDNIGYLFLKISENGTPNRFGLSARSSGINSLKLIIEKCDIEIPVSILFLSSCT